MLRRDDAPALAVTAGRHPRSPATNPPVLLVHGMGGDHTTWRRIAADLESAGRRVIGVDLRGHGRSGRADYRLDDFRDDLAYVLDALEVPHADVVAHSLGAHAALRLAMAHPQRVRRLVLEEPPPMPRDAADLAEAITPGARLGERLRGLGALVADPRPFLRFDKTMPEQVGAQFQQIDTDWWQGLDRVSAPAVVVSGGPRSFLPPRHLRSLAQALPAGSFVTVEAGHSVHRDRPRAFAHVTRGHLFA